eukprot:m.116745 g.116745  ORF g.116745 m.116745 type:complete len:945 (-) comp28534_c0_seq1:59-2893(-)
MSNDGTGVGMSPSINVVASSTLPTALLSRVAKVTTPGKRKGKKPKSKRTGLTDDMSRTLIPQIRQIMLRAAVDGRMDIEDLVEHLRRKHPTYRRKALGPFRICASKAYSLMLQQDETQRREIAKDSGPSGPDEDLDSLNTTQSENESDEEQFVAVERGRTLLNKRLGASYKAQNDLGPGVVVVDKPTDTFAQSTPMSITGEHSPSSHITSQLADLGVGSASPDSMRGAVLDKKQLSEAEFESSSSVSKKRSRPNSKRRRIVKKNTNDIEGQLQDALNDSSKTLYKVARPSARFDHLGGIETCMQDVRELVELMFTHIELFKHLGSQPPRGLLIQGPPGCGKTLLAHAIAGELDVPFLKVSAPALIGSASGDSERSIRALFDQAVEECLASPTGCLIFIDEIDAITPKRETAQREMERRVVAQLLSCMDEISLEKTGGKPILLLGATNRADSLDPALRRAGRFDREITIPVPDKDARHSILRVLCRNLRLDGEFDIAALAAMTPGYVGADFLALTNEAALLAVARTYGSIISQTPTMMAVDSPSTSSPVTAEISNDAIVEPVGETQRVVTTPSSVFHSLAERATASNALRSQATPFTPEQLAGLSITFVDFEGALKRVQPSAKREGFATVPDVTWDDVGALSGPREELEDAIVLPLMNPELCRRAGIPKPAGVLLYGPPGCGKTLLAKAVANGSHANFISVKGPELLNKFVGESERAVRQVFHRARTSSPCIIFFDELDALCPVRDNDSSGRSSQRLVNQLLTEMDGFDGEDGKQVFIIAATNRPDIIDPAMLRPGRLDKLVYVDIPGELARGEILQTHTRKLKLSPDINLHEIAKDPRAAGFTGADLAALVREAGTLSLRRILKDRTIAYSKTMEAPMICLTDIDKAFTKVSPSVSKRDLVQYRSLVRKLRGSRAVLHTNDVAPRVVATPSSTSTPPLPELETN